MNVTNFIGEWVLNSNVLEEVSREEMLEDLKVIRAVPEEFDFSYITAEAVVKAKYPEVLIRLAVDDFNERYNANEVS